jgi:hypothetical protein
MEQHVKILGILFIVRGLFCIFGGFIISAIFTSGLIMINEPRIMTIILTIGYIITAFLFVVGVPTIIAGAGLMARKKWGRIMGIIMAIVGIFDVPLGTALGIYALWVLLKPETEQILTA